jgi:WD40 repeat protein
MYKYLKNHLFSNKNIYHERCNPHFDCHRAGRCPCGSGQQKIDINNVEPAVEASSDDLLALDEAPDRLAKMYKVKADLVKLRFFAGLSGDETIKVWSIDLEHERVSLRGYKGWNVSVAFSPDGNLIASAGGDKDRTIKVWETIISSD